MNNRAEEEKVREFCYEIAMALRRITGKVVENDCQGLVGDAGEECAPPDGTVDNDIQTTEVPENRT